MSSSKLASQVLSQFGAWSQTERMLRLTTPLGPTQLLAESFKGTEGLSEGFRLEILALSTNAHIELKTLLGQPVLLELLTAHSRTELRPFHGHIMLIETVGSNGGMARYKLIVEPWTAFLAYRRDSTTYQDMNVFEILESIFKDYEGQGKLVPAWRLDINDLSVYPKRSLNTQYQESDLAFIQRLMSEEGLFSWIEHEGDASSATLGSHTFVIADHNGAFQPNEQAEISFTQPGAVMKHDSIDRWRSQRRWQTNVIEICSWDYRQINTRPISSLSNANNSNNCQELIAQDAPGAYSYESRAQGQRIADNQLLAIEAHNKIFTGAGTVRTLVPGTTFSLSGQAEHDQGSADDKNFLVLRVVHQAHNNLSAELQAQVKHCLGHLVQDEENEADDEFDERNQIDFDGKHNTGNDKGERPLYRNRIEAIRSSIAYKNLSTDQHGQLLHPKPTVHGQQTAIVVGPVGNVIYTDRDHRIKVQFHWQRGDNSHSRLAHPNPDGHTGAPADECAGTWVRVAAVFAPIAGANWGSHAIPRIGQEVLIDFIEGDIDRPVVIGSLYNGKGNENAQHNQVIQGTGRATGNAPAWFPGSEGGHAHPASLSGIKTQAMSQSQQGIGGYNQLVFDDSPGQSRTSLQQHASAHQGTAELNLGHLRHQSDNQRLNKTGYGAELKTQHSAAIRAGQGMLISTDARANASSSQLDSTEAESQIGQSHQLQLALATTAQKHNAKLKDDKKQDEPEAKKIPAIQQQGHSAEVIKAAESGNCDGQQSEHGGQGKVTAYSEAQLQLSSPAGIAITTPKDVILSAGNTSNITASQDLNFAAQGNHHHAVKAGISLFTYGKLRKDAPAEEPNKETGIKLHAATGKVSTQSQSDKTSITADKTITVASTNKTVMVAAQKHVLFTATGAFLKLEGGNITIAAPGKVEFKASMKELAGAASSNLVLPDLPRTKLYGGHFQILDKANKEPMPGRLYRKYRANGLVFFGKTDLDGHTQRAVTAEPEVLKIVLDRHEKFHRSKTDEVDVDNWFNGSDGEE